MQNLLVFGLYKNHEKHRGGLPCGRGREAPEEHNQQYKKKQKGDRSDYQLFYHFLIPNSGFKELGNESPVLVKLMMQTIYQNDRRSIKHIGAQQFGMKFLLRGLYAHNGLLYFHTRMENGTNMPYSVDFITFKVVDKKMAKRTAIQEQLLQPLLAYHQVMQVCGMGSEHTVFALEQFSLAEDKQLEVMLYERNGGRTLTFYVTAEDLQIAKKIDKLKLNW